jgi:hypothetical protein
MKYNLSTEDTLLVCREIADEYARGGMRLTVRQLYYQIVSRGLETNADAVYKRIVRILAKARLEGRFPMTLIEDRGRDAGWSRTDSSINPKASVSAVKSSVLNAPDQWIWSNRWFGQIDVPVVWVEKDALTGVFEPACVRAGVGLFALKGYASVQALWEFISRIAAARKAYSESALAMDLTEAAGLDPAEVMSVVRVVYFGDHDPDGIEIPESALRNVTDLIRNQPVDAGRFGMPEIVVDRVALTREQIETYNPPPFPAKPSSARYDRYVERTGLRDAWELDALRPDVLRDIVARETERCYINEIGDKLDELVDDIRDEMRELLRETDLTEGL